MAQVTITYPDEDRDRIIEAICTRLGYQETVDGDGEDVDNPQSPDEFAATKVAEWVRSQVRKHETEKAAREAEQAIAEEVEAIEVTVGD